MRRLRTGAVFAAGLAVGAAATAAAPAFVGPRPALAAPRPAHGIRRAAIHGAAGDSAAAIRVTLYRFETNAGAGPAFDAWMRWYRANHAPIVATLEREHMYVEALFRDTVGQPGVLYWLTVDGPGAQSVDSSPLEIDRQHLAHMRQVLRRSSRRVLATEVTLTPPFLDSAVARHRAANP